MADPVEIQGLRDFRRTLRRVEPQIDKQLRQDIKAIAERVAEEARAHAPRLTGEYARSIRPRVTLKGATVGSNLPQSGVLHWGGTIRPRGVPIVFPPRPVIGDALDHQMDRILEELGEAVEKAAHDAGWHD